MQNTSLITEKNISFKTVEGSNYLLTTSFKKEYVVDYQQFLRIMRSYAKTDADLITVNNSFVNRRYIADISPTKKSTDKQIENRKKAEEMAQERRASKRDDLPKDAKKMVEQFRKNMRKKARV